MIASGEPIGYRETAILAPVGGPIRVAGGYSRAPSEPGGAVRATAILRDITAVRALEQLREGFVATVSHELRTPLALVRGYAETVLHFDLDADQQRDYVDRIHQVTTRLGSLVDQILDVTHLDADPLILERAPVAFAALAARLHGDLALSGDDARLVVELPPDLPPVDVDAGRIGRVLENLVGNALKYAPDGSPVVVRASVDGDWLVAIVDDEGVGVPEAERSLVARAVPPRVERARVANSWDGPRPVHLPAARRGARRQALARRSTRRATRDAGDVQPADPRRPAAPGATRPAHGACRGDARS